MVIVETWFTDLLEYTAGTIACDRRGHGWKIVQKPSKYDLDFVFSRYCEEAWKKDEKEFLSVPLAEVLTRLLKAPEDSKVSKDLVQEEG
jgi:hypothetical protein